MSIPPADPPRSDAAIIADALSRLRGRRGPRESHEHPHGGWPGHGRHGGPPGSPGGGRRGWSGDPAGRHDLPARLRVLEALAGAPSPLGVGEIAAVIGVDQPRASRLVQQGVENGWVRREADPEDARRARIVLTDEGRRMLGGIRGQRRERLERALAAFTSAERAELARLLNKLADGWE